jgi:hypothetical protein
MLSVDHIIELKDGGEPFNKLNLRVVCGSHHHQKTWAEKKKRSWAAVSDRLLARLDEPSPDVEGDAPSTDDPEDQGTGGPAQGRGGGHSKMEPKPRDHHPAPRSGLKPLERAISDQLVTTDQRRTPPCGK